MTTKFPSDQLNAAAHIVLLVLASILSLPLFLLLTIHETIKEMKRK